MRMMTGLWAALLCAASWSASVAQDAPADSATAETAKMMRAAVVTDGQIKIESVPAPMPREGQVLQVLPMDQAARAWDMNRSRHTRGKLVLVP